MVLPIVLGIAAIVFFVVSVNAPHGGWDACSIWNLRARFLFRAGAGWRSAFIRDLPWAHSDYPLLLPLSIARVWTENGAESTLAPQRVAFGFAASAVATLFSALLLLRGRAWACCGALLLLGTPLFLQIAVQQYADVPLAAYLAPSAGVDVPGAGMYLEQDFPERGAWLTGVSGLAAGCTAWTKNEGILLSVALLLARVAFFADRRVVKTVAFI